jgi:hypothetical protein
VLYGVLMAADLYLLNKYARAGLAGTLAHDAEALPPAAAPALG